MAELVFYLFFINISVTHCSKLFNQKEVTNIFFILMGCCFLEICISEFKCIQYQYIIPYRSSVILTKCSLKSWMSSSFKLKSEKKHQETLIFVFTTRHPTKITVMWFSAFNYIYFKVSFVSAPACSTLV